MNPPISERVARWLLPAGADAAVLPLLLGRGLAIGAEVRTKPDNLRFAREGTAFDVFGTWFVNKGLSATLAFVALGPVARQGSQNGVYLSLQGGF